MIIVITCRRRGAVSVVFDVGDETAVVTHSCCLFGTSYPQQHSYRVWLASSRGVKHVSERHAFASASAFDMGLTMGTCTCL